MQPSILGLALALVAAPAGAQPPSPEQKPLGDQALHEFAAKWMAAHDDLAELARYRDANRAPRPFRPSPRAAASTVIRSRS